MNDPFVRNLNLLETGDLKKKLTLVTEEESCHIIYKIGPQNNIKCVNYVILP